MSLPSLYDLHSGKYRSRLKTEQHQKATKQIKDTKEPFILQNLKDAIELHFKTKHAPSHYADLLNISAKALAKLSKTHFNKTLTDLISERIIIEAKRELYLTNKAVKEIAYELVMMTSITSAGFSKPMRIFRHKVIAKRLDLPLQRHTLEFIFLLGVPAQQHLILIASSRAQSGYALPNEVP